MRHRRRSEVTRPSTEDRSSVVAHEVDALPLVVVGPTSPIWALSSPDLARLIYAWRTSKSIVWVEPPPGGSPTRLVDAARGGGVSVRVVPSARISEAVAEDVVAVPAPSTATMRSVVSDLAAAADVSDRDLLVSILETALSEAGL